MGTFTPFMDFYCEGAHAIMAIREHPKTPAHTRLPRLCAFLKEYFPYRATACCPLRSLQ